MVDSVRHVGAGVQGRRLPLRPDGPPPKANMLRSARALDALTLEPRRRGRQGASTCTARAGTSARSPTTRGSCRPGRANMAGTGIGTFSDRLRDAVRGGGPFDDDPRIQGFGTGLFTDPNDAPANGTPAEQRAAAAALQGPDQARPGRQPARLHASATAAGATVNGRRRSTTTASPPATPPSRARSITYVDAHDNETLFDALPYKLPAGDDDGRPGAHEHALAGDHGARPGAVVLARRAPTCCARSRWTATASTPATGSTASTGPVRTTFGSGLPPAADNAGQVGLPCGRCSPTRRSSRPRPTWRAASRAAPTCCGCASRRRCSGSAAPRLIQEKRHASRSAGTPTPA